MLKKTSDELHDIKFYGSPTFTASFSVPDEDLSVFNLDNTAVRYCDLENIIGQIFNAVLAMHTLHMAVGVEVCRDFLLEMAIKKDL